MENEAKLVSTRPALSNTFINSYKAPLSGQACNPLISFGLVLCGGGILRLLVLKWLLLLN
jgi:hypothetical protein